MGRGETIQIFDRDIINLININKKKYMHSQQQNAEKCLTCLTNLPAMIKGWI